MELNGNLLTDEFYKFNHQYTIVNLTDNDYNKIITNVLKCNFHMVLME